MSSSDLIVMILLFFATSVVGVVTGSNSLVTVPVMFQFGIDEKVAVATNMFGLTFMAIGGTIPFMRQGSIEFRKLTPLVVLTIAGSAIGAMLVGLITNQSIKAIVSVAMIVMVVFMFVRPHGATEPSGVTRPAVARPLSMIVYLLTFLLAIYGGLFSGGYVTVLTATLVTFAAMSFTQSVAATKFINVFSSGIATLVFMWEGLVDYRLGIFLAVSMFAGAFVGAHYAAKMNEIWLRRIFLATVFILAIKTILDFAR
ncbi:MAG TPA: sulfite exporter TauE/SafE family protein [Pyrinomonadaceae bacterium]|nr:sulfite exporter TauE/SafE family protein [Pyrinomonadaceae bacterium]